MLLLAFLLNLSLSLALVANRASLSSRCVGVTTHIHQTTAKLAHPLSLSHPLTIDSQYFIKYHALSATATNTPSSSAAPPSTGKRQTILATTILVLLDIQVRSLFLKYSIPFPSSLAGCGAPFASMIPLNTFNEKWGDGMYQVLNPGATLMAKWPPIFFVPSLITLPLASGLGDVWEWEVRSHLQYQYFTPSSSVAFPVNLLLSLQYCWMSLLTSFSKYSLSSLVGSSSRS